MWEGSSLLGVRAKVRLKRVVEGRVGGRCIGLSPCLVFACSWCLWVFLPAATPATLSYGIVIERPILMILLSHQKIQYQTKKQQKRLLNTLLTEFISCLVLLHLLPYIQPISFQAKSYLRTNWWYCWGRCWRWSCWNELDWNRTAEILGKVIYQVL